MARTKEINLIYKITPNEVIAPDQVEIDRKDKWIKSIQQSIPSEWEYELIKVKYSLHNPAIEDMVKFFNGTVVTYYAIQNEEIMKGTPSTETIQRNRDIILDAILGYDVRLAKLIERKRASTTEFREVQQWYVFLETVKEELFDPSGYEFPDSEVFWKKAEEVGYDQAKRISIEKLQQSLARKLYDTKK